MGGRPTAVASGYSSFAYKADSASGTSRSFVPAARLWVLTSDSGAASEVPMNWGFGAIQLSAMSIGLPRRLG